MRSKKISKAVKRRLTILVPMFIGIFLLCIFTFFTYMIRINNLSVERKRLQAELEHLQSRTEILNNEIARLKDPAYIAAFARENYYYTRRGEFVIRMEELKPDTMGPSMETESRVHYLLLSGLGVIVLLSFISWIRHKRTIEEEN